MPNKDLAEERSRPSSGLAQCVAKRISLFRERHPDGRVTTTLRQCSEGWVVFRASLYRTASDARPAATGWAAGSFGLDRREAPGAIEDAETAAMDRALAHLGLLGVIRSPAAIDSCSVAGRSAISADPLINDLRDLLVAASARGAAPARVACVGRAIDEHHIDSARAARLISHLQRWLVRRSVLVSL